MNITREEMQQLIDSIRRSRDTAMYQTMSARIPECGTFSGIAQDLDFAISLLQSKLAEKDDVEPMTAMVDAAMFEMNNVYPPLRRSECKRLIQAALSVQFTHPAPKPMTNDQIYELYSEPRSDAEMVEFARAVERHHGIGK